jgi:SAM-dependent methyltransferase
LVIEVAEAGGAISDHAGERVEGGAIPLPSARPTAYRSLHYFSSIWSRTLSHRSAVVRSLIPPSSKRLLDVGCGPITTDYALAPCAETVVAVDWRLNVVSAPPGNVIVQGGDFLEIDLLYQKFDVVVASDVFEHVAIEREAAFARRCADLLSDDGVLIVSVPNSGTYAWLDPYQVKPLIGRIALKLGLTNETHNGFCDVRKGHKHYSLGELEARFAPLIVSDVRYWGYFYDPLESWCSALSRKSGLPLGQHALRRRVADEFAKDYGADSFNIAVRFRKT